MAKLKKVPVPKAKTEHKKKEALKRVFKSKTHSVASLSRKQWSPAWRARQKGK